MTALLGNELRRMWSRRLLKLLGVMVLLVVVAGATIAFFHSSRDVAAARQRVQAQRQQELDACRRGDFHIPGQNRPGFDLDKACKRFIPKFAVTDPRWHYVQLRDVVLGTSPPLGILCLLLGASFIGAEWQRGTVTTELTWEPRRIRLLACKLVAVAIVGFCFTVAAEAMLAAALWPVAAFRGSVSGLDAAWVREVAGVALRAAAVGGLTAVVGCAIATVGRNTTAALGAAFVYFAVLEGFIRGFRPKWQPWLLGDNAAQFISNQTVGPAMADRTTLDVAVTLLLYALAFTAIAMLFFNRRDVT